MIHGVERLQQRMHQVAQDAMRQAALWAETVAFQLVSIQTGLDGPGSPPGTPPFRRTGYGQSTIGTEEVEGGARIGVRAMGMAFDRHGKPRKKTPDFGRFPGKNYLAYWDANGRPWLINAWESVYKPLVDRIVARTLKMEFHA